MTDWTVGARDRLDKLRSWGLIELLPLARRGVEREALRVQADGVLSQKPHPPSLGSALMHPSITVDYSESQLEIVTSPAQSIPELFRELEVLHRFTVGELKDELLWPASMPCFVADPSTIPIARFGDSNSGRMKHIYRQGLARRYGRRMQIISGVHYNFSFGRAFFEGIHAHAEPEESIDDYIAMIYLGMIRNFLRHGWALIYLFGASPAVSRSFTDHRIPWLIPLGEDTLEAPWGTSLRVSDLGYQSSAQVDLVICFDTLVSYTRSIRKFMQIRHPDYDAIGVKVDGEYRQLRSTLLQVENEYYSPIRPKQPTLRGEKPVLALERRGLQYLEVRLLDVDPYHPLGISPEKAAFVEVFLLSCMLWDSPYFLGEECRKGARHRMEVARSGRDPSLRLPMDDSEVTVREGLDQLWPALELAADCMDQAHGSTHYRSAVDQQAAVVEDPQLLPSSRLVRELREGSDHVARMLELSHAHKKALSGSLDAEAVSRMRELVRCSHREQADLETGDDLSFEEYLRRYYEG